MRSDREQMATPLRLMRNEHEDGGRRRHQQDNAPRTRMLEAVVGTLENATINVTDLARLVSKQVVTIDICTSHL